MSDRKRPGALLAISIIGILLGALGGCVGCYTVVVTANAEAMAEFQERMAELQPDSQQRDFQRELNARVMEIQARYRVPILAHQTLNLLASIVLLVAAIWLLKWRKNAPMLATLAVAANLVIDLGGGILQFILQRENQVVVSEAMRHFEGTGAPPGMERTMEGMMNASASMGVCWLVAILLFKIGYYGYTALYVRKPAVRELLTA